MATTNPILAAARGYTGMQSPVVPAQSSDVGDEESGETTADSENESAHTGTTSVSANSNTADIAAAIQSSLASTQVLIGAGIDQATSTYSQSKDMTSTLKSSYDATAAANEIIDTQKQNAELEAQNRNIRLLDAAGGAQYQEQLMSQKTEAGQKIIDLTKERSAIMETEHTGITLIDTVINGFKSIPTAIKLNDANAEELAIENQIRSTTAAQESFAQINAKTVETLNTATIQANNDKHVQLAVAQKATADLNGLASNANNMAQIIGLSSKQSENLLKEAEAANLPATLAVREAETNARMQELNFKLESWPITKSALIANAKMTQLEYDKAAATGASDIATRLASNQEAQSKLADAAALEDEWVTKVHQGQAMLALPLDTPQVIKAGMQSRDVVTRNKYASFFNSGSTGKLGATAAQAWISLRQQDPTGGSQVTKGSTALTQIATELSTKYAKEQKDVPKQPQYMEDFKAQADKWYGAQSKVISGPDSIFSAPPMATLKTAVAPMDSPFYNKVFKDIDTQQVQPSVIMNSTLAALESKSITPEQAARGIVDVFSQAVHLNNTGDGGFTRYGLPKQTSYLVQFPELANFYPDGSGGLTVVKSAPVNLVDYTQVMQAITKLRTMRASESAKRAGKSTFTIPE